MDESQHSNPTSKPNQRPSSDRASAVVDDHPADLAASEKRVAEERLRDSDQSELCRSNPSDGPSVVVYCGNEEQVCRGFLIALRAMGVVVIEQSAEPAKPPVARAKQ
jgi:hypothetical protein